tara:strand:+ start:3260 stop:4120 length:861 start_codon:yes stop_codon:yes gene_type:complete
MSKAPAFQFYAGDFLSDLKVATMSMEERGVYITLLSYAWLEEGLPQDINKLARLCGNPKNFSKTWEVVGECFYIDEDDKLKNPKMEEIRETLQSYKKKMSEAGKKGMESRWKNNQVKTKLKQSNNSSSSSSSSTSTHTKKKRVKIDYDGFVTRFNTLCGPFLAQVTKLSDARKRQIKKILDTWTLGDAELVFIKITESDFLTGKGEYSNWKATFDWVIKESNWIKVIEGNYDNQASIKKQEEIKNTAVICTECSHKFITQEKHLHNVKCEECSEYGIISQSESNYL